MKTRLMLRLAALTLLFQLGGCSSIESHWPFANHPLPPAAPPIHAHRQAAPPTAAVSRAREEEENDRRTGAVRKQPASASAPAQSPAVPAGPTNVTLEDNDADLLQAQALLDDADRRLAHVDR